MLWCDFSSDWPTTIEIDSDWQRLSARLPEGLKVNQSETSISYQSHEARGRLQL